jgi:hypothetical protein
MGITETRFAVAHAFPRWCSAFPRCSAAAALTRVAVARYALLGRVCFERAPRRNNAEVAAARAILHQCTRSTGGWARRRRRKRATANVAASLPCERARARTASLLRTGARAREPCLAAQWLQQQSVIGKAVGCARRMLGWAGLHRAGLGRDRVRRHRRSKRVPPEPLLHALACTARVLPLAVRARWRVRDAECTD